MNIKQTTLFLIVMICALLLLVFTPPDSGSAQDPIKSEWLRMDEVPEGLIVGCQDTAGYECGVLCGWQYKAPVGDSLDIVPIGCVPFKFPISDQVGAGRSSSTHLPIITTEGTED